MRNMTVCEWFDRFVLLAIEEYVRISGAEVEYDKTDDEVRVLLKKDGPQIFDARNLRVGMAISAADQITVEAVDGYTVVTMIFNNRDS